MASDFYKKQLADPRWQKKRLEILQRDDFSCNTCFSRDKELHVHHKYYLPNTDYWDYPDNCYETLCYECHELETADLKKDSAKLVQSMKEHGANSFIFSFLESSFRDCRTENEMYCLIEMIHSLSFLKKHGEDLYMIIEHRFNKMADKLNVAKEVS